MSNKFKGPEVTKSNDAVTEQIKEEAVPLVAQRATPGTIYINGINNFLSFIKNEKFSGSPEERQKFQLSFIDSLEGMLSLDDVELKKTLDHFIKVILENKDVMNYTNILAPQKAVNSKRSEQVMEQYKRFMLFIMMLADHAKDRKRFQAYFDVTKFINMFNDTIKQRLTNYIYR